MKGSDRQMVQSERVQVGVSVCRSQSVGEVTMGLGRLVLLLLQAFIKRCISGTSPFIGTYTHYNKMYVESYKRDLKNV